MKQRALEADERWKSKPSYLDPPKQQQPEPPAKVHEPLGQAAREYVDQSGGEDMKSLMGDHEEVAEATGGDAKEPKAQKREREENPWKQADRGGPGENWKPAAWSPGVAQRR